MKCNTIKCPALPCENPVAEPQQCCPRCTGTMSGISSSKHLVSESLFALWLSVLCVPPPHSSSDEPRIPAGLRASVKSCRYNGTIYQPGETFNKHDLFPSKQSNQCVMCTCSVSYIAFTSSVLVRPGLLFYGSGERISHSETDSLWSYRGDVGLQWAMKPEGYRSLEILCVCMDMVKQGCWGGCSIPLNRGIIKAISR